MELGVAAPSCNNEQIKNGRLDYQSNIPPPDPANRSWVPEQPAGYGKASESHCRSIPLSICPIFHNPRRPRNSRPDAAHTGPK